ncbi:MBL fold metallo-hydrolase [Candidatus Woesearchaeota archaeon]|nr:MBL fold metallo-hydrolase [Candidatus Woesearchaeota archaeon]MBW3006289.1 MBL fold metallo-hydrolase [Candidatus Woesearchaeota archaeon]
MKIKWFGHASFELKIGNKVLYIDPYKGEPSEYKDKADIILVSRWHYSNCRLELIKKVRQEDTVILAPRDVISQTAGITAEAGKAWDLSEEIRVTPVDAYTINRLQPIPKGTAFGYLIEAEKKTIYYAGNSSFTPEMAKVKADIIILPVGGTFVMDAREAAKAAEIINPKLAIPSHYGSLMGSIDDANWFKEILEAKNIKVLILEVGKEKEI